MVTVGNRGGKEKWATGILVSRLSQSLMENGQGPVSRLWLSGWFGRTGIHSLTRLEGIHQMRAIHFIPHLLLFLLLIYFIHGRMSIY